MWNREVRIPLFAAAYLFIYLFIYLEREYTDDIRRKNKESEIIPYYHKGSLKIYKVVGLFGSLFIFTVDASHIVYRFTLNIKYSNIVIIISY